MMRCGMCGQGYKAGSWQQHVCQNEDIERETLASLKEANEILARNAKAPIVQQGLSVGEGGVVMFELPEGMINITHCGDSLEVSLVNPVYGRLLSAHQVFGRDGVWLRVHRFPEDWTQS